MGVVIGGEEHESSYKQAASPRYHAREAAIVRARAEGALVVLGSATPSLESWERTERGQAIRLTLPDRAAGAQLPSVQVVDLRTVMREAQARFDHDQANAAREERVHRARFGSYFYAADKDDKPV